MDAKSIKSKTDMDKLLLLIDRKKQVDKNIMEMESNIVKLESSYLSLTKQHGNIFSGIDKYFSTIPNLHNSTDFKQDFSIKNPFTNIIRRVET